MLHVTTYLRVLVQALGFQPVSGLLYQRLHVLFDCVVATQAASCLLLYPVQCFWVSTVLDLGLITSALLCNVACLLKPRMHLLRRLLFGMCIMFIVYYNIWTHARCMCRNQVDSHQYTVTAPDMPTHEVHGKAYQSRLMRQV